MDNQSKHLETDVTKLELTPRVINALLMTGIRTVRDLVQKTIPEMKRIPNLGKISINQLKYVLEQMNLTFGMELEPKKEEPEPQFTVFEQLNRSNCRNAIDAFEKSYKQICKLTETKGIIYKDVDDAFAEHKKVVYAFEDAYKKLWS